MALTRSDIITRHANDWRNLRAWGRSLDNVRIEYVDREHARRAGTCWTYEQRLVVYRQARLSDQLSTLLHEMAHAVEISDSHGLAWQRRFAAAVAEVTGYVVPPAAEDYRIVNDAARDAMRKWWHRSGGLVIEKLVAA